MSVSAVRPVAGWYADPLGTTRQRWWDGAAWTQRVQEPAAPRPVDAVAEPAGFSFPPLPPEIPRVDPLPAPAERRVASPPPVVESVAPLKRTGSAA